MMSEIEEKLTEKIEELQSENQHLTSLYTSYSELLRIEQKRHGEDVEKLQEELKVVTRERDIVQDDDNYLLDKVEKLEAKIEAMKCYQNCANKKEECVAKNCHGCKKWELM